MATCLVPCSSCGVFIFASEKDCPFCAAKVPKIFSSGGLRRAIGAAAGAVAFVSGIGCAYGCPDGMCGGADAGHRAAADANVDDSSTSDAMLNDGGADAFHDADLDAASDAILDAPGDGG